MIVDRWDSRISDILKAGERFIQESDYPITYDPALSQESIWYYFNDIKSVILADYTKDTLNGLAILSKNNEWHKEYFGYIGKFYVVPEARGTGAGRRLAQESVEWFDKNGCVVSFVTPTGAIGQDRRFVNLMKKVGFQETLAGILVRKHSEQSK